MMLPVCLLAIESEDDRAYMTQLYLDYQRLMYKTVYDVVRSREDAEDLTQAVLERLIDRIPLLRQLEENTRTAYIVSACRHAALNFRRDRSRHGETVEYDDTLDSRAYRTPEEMVIRQENIDSLRRVWPLLDERSRLLLEGYYLLGKPTGELGKALGIKPTSVRMALTRARRTAYELATGEKGKE